MNLSSPLLRVGACVSMLAGCATADPTTASLVERPTLVAVGEAGPTVGDQSPHVPVAFRFADGRTVPLDREATAFVPRWRDGAALIDPERRLYEVSPDGRRRMLARGATGALTTDGEFLAYVYAPDTLADLRIHDGVAERTVARGLASIGVVRLGDPILFVGASPGGIIGVWASVDGEAQCLTNCDLRTGTPWMEHFVPPPTDASSFEITGTHVTWTDPEGARHEVAR